jgi:LPPG:FO 2-phospho-L-lactate transferase
MVSSANDRSREGLPKVAALAGGVGGAKLAHGLSLVLPPENLTVIVNTGDDFEHLGLYISPDIDTVCYTLAGLANPTTGWGREGETWQALRNVARLGGPDWFNIGDQDLGTHLERTRRLAVGERLSTITGDFCRAWGVAQTVLPMTDDRVATWVETEDMGWLPFQEYFVHQQCAPKVIRFRFEGIEKAAPAPGVVESLQGADYVVICPSNPWVSIGPILATRGLSEVIREKCVVAVSPIVGGKAIKGPAAKMYSELGIDPSAVAVARQYNGLLTGFVLDEVDRDLAGAAAVGGAQVLATDTVMKDAADRQRLAVEVLRLCSTLDGRIFNL